MNKKALFAAILAAACSDRDPSALESLRVDRPLETVALVREAQGSARGGDDLYVPSRPTLVNGDVWVLDEGNDHLVRFDSTLSTARTFGRSGQGPGEIEFAQDLALDGDRLIVAETGNGRLSIFDTTGTFREALPMARPPKHIAVTREALIATTTLAEDYAYRVDPQGGIERFAAVPRSVQRLARSDTATYLRAGPFIAPAPGGGLYVVDPSVLALSTFDREGRLTSTRLLPEPFRGGLLEQRVRRAKTWGARAAAFIDTPATKRISVSDDGRLLVLFPLPDHWGLLIDPGTGSARPLPLPSDRRMHDILWAATDASLVGDRLLVTSGSQLYEFRMGQDSAVALSPNIVWGAADAPHRLVVFSDYQCPACALLDRSAGPALGALTESGRLRIEVRHFPLVGHRRAPGAAASAVCAARQGAGREMHEALFRTVANWSSSAPSGPWFGHLADSLGLDSPELERCMRSTSVAELLAADLAMGRAAGLIGVPAVFLDGRLLTFRSPAGLVRRLESLTSEPEPLHALSQGVP